EDAVAGNAGGVPRDPVRALGWTTDHSLRSAPGGSFFSRGVAGAEAKRAIQDQAGGNLRGGARRFSALTSVALRAPSVSAERKAKPDRSCAIKTGHFNVLPTLFSANAFSANVFGIMHLTQGSGITPHPRPLPPP